VPYGDPEFEEQPPEVKKQQIDDKFRAYVIYRAEEEAKAEKEGAFTSIRAQVGKGGKPLAQAFKELMQEKFNKLEELIELPDFKPADIQEADPSIQRAIRNMRRDYATSRGRVMGDYLSSLKTELKTGSLLGGFFTRYEVNPIAQRLFLINLTDQGFISPFEGDEGDYLAEEGGAIPDLDSESERKRVDKYNRDLAEAADRGALGRLLSSDNKKFQQAKSRSIKYLHKVSRELMDTLQREFWRNFEEELRLMAEQLLDSFRLVAETADKRADEAETQTESFRQDPGAKPDSDVAQYYLDAEVLRDDRERERLWNLFYMHHLDRSIYFKTEDIFPLITEAFVPQRDPNGRLRFRDANEIVAVVREQLMDHAVNTYTEALGPKGMDLDLARALDFEQRYIVLHDEGADFAELRRTARLDDAVEEVSEDKVRRGIEDKLRRLADECVLLAHVDANLDADQNVTPAKVFYAGLAPQYNTDEDTSLGKLLGGVVSGLNFVDDWNEKDSLVLYRAMLGIPLYFYKNVNGSLYPSYRKAHDDPGRQYPLHIEGAWETGDTELPDLDPVKLRRHAEMVAAAQKADADRLAREDRIREFALCAFSRQVDLKDGGYVWRYGDMDGPLGGDRAEAFTEYNALEQEIVEALAAEAKSAWERQTADRRSRLRLIEELGAHKKRLTGLMFAAKQEMRDAEQGFIAEERDVVDGILDELESDAPVVPFRRSR